MVSELHARKAALEAKLAEKSRELKVLCIQEAELTGILPPEIPLEPGESPPIIRRRVGTSFVFPENLINHSKPKFKEEDSVAALELERQIQLGIADAALGLANDGNATKSVRRKHRSLYQQSQGRLVELESRLNVLRQPHNVPKQRKKPRPPLDQEDVDGDAVGLGLLHDGGISLSPPPVLQPGNIDWEHQHHHELLMRHSATNDGLNLRTSKHVQPHQGVSHPHLQRYGSGGHYNGSIHMSHHYSTLASCAHSELDRCRGRLEQSVSAPGYWLRYEATVVENASVTTPRQLQRSANYIRQPFQTQVLKGSDRFTGSLDRRKPPPSLHGGSSPSQELWSAGEMDLQQIISEGKIDTPVPPAHHHNKKNIGLAETLLPGQTYPEHGLGLVRTQSLGSVEASKKNKEKEWYETSLDAAPSSTLVRPSKQGKVEISSDISSNLSRSSSNVSSERRTQHAQTLEIPPRENFDTVVPFESPKNHTVVQAGKWQPYREVTKPFEMADFYKYSTKYRKNENMKHASNQTKHVAPMNQPNITQTEEPSIVEDTTPQQKCLYQPLQPMTCKPLDPNSNTSDEMVTSEELDPDMLTWYQDKSLPRSATLV